jgi:hypothetical protein
MPVPLAGASGAASARRAPFYSTLLLSHFIDLGWPVAAITSQRLNEIVPFFNFFGKSTA